MAKLHEVKVFQAEFEVKEASGDGSSSSGEFTGYASIFGNVDLGGDVIVKDAFKEFVANANGEVKILYGHDSGGGLLAPSTGAGGLPIGLAKVEQNAKGLKVQGRLNMRDPFVQRVHSHMKFGSLDAMSIGYDILPGGAKDLANGNRELSGLKLWEVSPVVWGMNPKAYIGSVKSVRSVREVEDWLRDAVGLSRSRAKRIAGDIWKSLGEREAESSADLLDPRDVENEGMRELLEVAGRWGGGGKGA